jgi:hypothetical protein
MVYKLTIRIRLEKYRFALLNPGRRSQNQQAAFNEAIMDSWADAVDPVYGLLAYSMDFLV